jgi:hypothetical protein
MSIFEHQQNYDINTVDTYVNETLNKSIKSIKMTLNKDIEFYKPTRINKVLSNVICDYIVTQSEEFAKKMSVTVDDVHLDGWDTARHRNYPTTDLPTTSIPQLKELVNNVIYYQIFPEIEKTYHVDKRLLTIGDAFVVKYDSKKQSYLEKHKDGCLFSFNVLLNDATHFEGGGTTFYLKNNVFTIKVEKGDCVIHAGHTEHGGEPITNGLRYILVGFIKYSNFFNKINNPLTIKPNTNFNCTNENNLMLQTYAVKSPLLNEIITNLDVFEAGLFKSKKFQLLDASRQEMCCYEKMVYELFIFHLKRLHLYDNKDDYFCEHWIKLYTNNNHERKPILHPIHVDKNERLFSKSGILDSPILATVTYIVGDFTPTVITNTDSETFDKNNTINLNFGLAISMPSKTTDDNCVKHICFNPKNYHSVYNLNAFNDNYVNNTHKDYTRATILFNIWPKKPDESAYSVPYKNDNVIPLHIYQRDVTYFDVNPTNNIKHKQIKCINMFNLLQDVLNNTHPQNTISLLQNVYKNDDELINADAVILTI